MSELFEVCVVLNARGAEELNKPENEHISGDMVWEEGEKYLALSSFSNGREFEGWGTFKYIYKERDGGR